MNLHIIIIVEFLSDLWYIYLSSGYQEIFKVSTLHSIYIRFSPYCSVLVKGQPVANSNEALQCKTLGAIAIASLHIASNPGYSL